MAEELECNVLSKEERGEMLLRKKEVEEKICAILDEFEDRYPTIQLAVHTRLYFENKPYDEEIGGSCQVHHVAFTWKTGDVKYSGVTAI